MDSFFSIMNIKIDKSNNKIIIDHYFYLRNKKNRPIRKGISFEKANQRPDNESVTDENTDTVIKGVNRNRHNKIFEAMSTPLESDRAMRFVLIFFKVSRCIPHIAG